jgi:exodeoxyribonuclease V alpha subunit
MQPPAGQTRPTLPADLLRRLRLLHEANLARPLDLALARWLAEHDARNAETLALTGLLLSSARTAGHAGVRLPAHAGERIGETDLRLPPLDAWRGALAASPLVGSPGDERPLVLDGDLLYLHRFWRAEQRVADHVRARLAPAGENISLGELRPTFARLFPQKGETPDWQAVAAAAALRSRLLLIAGGPGTGKTTTVVRLLGLLLTADPDLKVALAAPTGKAANRLAASIAQQRDELDLPAAVRERIPAEAATLHRLLGYLPAAARFTRDAAHPLAADVVLVDEASMIDLLLFEALLAAVPEHGRLILLGDPDQLASVEAGFVFGDLCRAGEGSRPGPGLAVHAQVLGVRDLPATEDAPPPLRDAVVTLTKTYRFGPASGIGRLAAALRDGRGDEAVDILQDTAFPDAQLVPPAGIQDALLERMAPYARRMCSVNVPELALTMIEKTRLLAATRWGPRGVQALNRLVEDWLAEEGYRGAGLNYDGRPILVTANDYEVELFNGDLGVMWREGRDYVGCFPDGRGGVRRVPRHRLPPHESAWAMTVHKSQGSEFDDVLLVLPEEPISLLTRELLYTAVTRARQRVTVFGDAAVVRAAASRGEARMSGLAERLGK